MANTYTLIASNTLTTSAASVTFSSIPNTYTDLVLRWSARDTGSFTTGDMYITFNGNTANNYSHTYIMGDGVSASSSADSNTNKVYVDMGLVGGSATSNTFANVELYIPNYLASSNKPCSVDVAHELNGTYAYRVGHAGLWRNTSAITSITATTRFGQIAVGSSFFLYGVKAN